MYNHYDHLYDSTHYLLHVSYSWSGPQLPKGCGCIGFLSPMHKKITDPYSKREGGNPWNSGLSSQQ